MLHVLDSLLAWAAHSEHQEVWAGPFWSSMMALKVRRLLLPGVQNPSKLALLHHSASSSSLLMCCHLLMSHGKLPSDGNP
jgi:hypothetical protein